MIKKYNQVSLDERKARLKPNLQKAASSKICQKSNMAMIAQNHRPSGKFFKNPSVYKVRGKY